LIIEKEIIATKKLIPLRVIGRLTHQAPLKVFYEIFPI